MIEYLSWEKKSPYVFPFYRECARGHSTVMHGVVASRYHFLFICSTSNEHLTKSCWWRSSNPSRESLWCVWRCSYSIRLHRYGRKWNDCAIPTWLTAYCSWNTSSQGKIPLIAYDLFMQLLIRVHLIDELYSLVQQVHSIRINNRFIEHRVLIYDFVLLMGQVFRMVFYKCTSKIVGVTCAQNFIGKTLFSTNSLFQSWFLFYKDGSITMQHWHVEWWVFEMEVLYHIVLTAENRLGTVYKSIILHVDLLLMNMYLTVLELVYRHG